MTYNIILENDDLVLLSEEYPKGITDEERLQFCYSVNSKDEPIIKYLNTKTKKWNNVKAEHKPILSKYNIIPQSKENTLKGIYSLIVNALRVQSQDFTQVMNVLMAALICINDKYFKDKWLENENKENISINNLVLDLDLDLSTSEIIKIKSPKKITKSENTLKMIELIKDMATIIEMYNEDLNKSGIMSQLSKLTALTNLANPCDCINIIKQIYNYIKNELSNNFILTDLFDLIKNMNSKDLKNNANSNLEWTPLKISEFMALQFKDYIIDNDDKDEKDKDKKNKNKTKKDKDDKKQIEYSIIDPCCGSANLITAVLKLYRDKIGDIYEFDNMPELIPLMKTNAILSGRDENIHIKYGDFMKFYKSDEQIEILGELENVYKIKVAEGDDEEDNTVGEYENVDFQPCHFGIINPPYQPGQNGNEYEDINFVSHMMDFCDIGVAIFTTQHFGNMSKINKFKKDLFNKCIIRKVYNCGKIAFSSANVDVIIVVLERKEKFYPNDYNLKNDNITSIYQTEFKKLKNKKNVETKYEKKEDILIQERELLNENEDWTKSNAEEIFNINEAKIELIKAIHKDMMNEYKNNYNGRFDDSLRTRYLNNIDIIKNLDEKRFKQVNFNDMFEIPDKQKSHYTNESINKGYPLIGAAKNNNGVVGYLNNWDYENCFTIVKDGDGACGYVFYHNYKFSKVPTVYIMNLKQKLENIDINCKLISYQLHPLFNHSFKLTKDIFDNLKIWLYI